MSYVENLRDCTKQILKVFVIYQGDFPRPSGELRTKKCSFNANKFSIDYTSQVSYTLLGLREVIGKCVGAQHWRSVGADEIDYEMHLGKQSNK